jgi:Uma2 family endonuclease
MIDAGILPEDDPIELLEGFLVYKEPRDESLQNGLPPLRRGSCLLRPITVNEYHQMIEAGILAEDEPIELLEGFLVFKMPHNPAHDGTIQRASKKLARNLPTGWDIRIQSAITLDDSEPEPDLTVVRGDETRYMARHPVPDDIGLIIEVADSSLSHDRSDKLRLFALARIAVYWIINLVDRQIEVHTNPSGPSPTPGYATRQIVKSSEAVSLFLDRVVVATIPVSELLP